MAKKLSPIHPGEVLREEFLMPMKLSAYSLAKVCDVPRTRIERLIREETPVTADTALRLGKALNTSPAFWMNMQARFDLEMAEDALGKTIKKIEPIGARAA
jgi:addiction module HigA family antidote